MIARLRLMVVLMILIFKIKKAGANIFVVGSAIFKSENITKSSQFFHNIINTN